MLKPFLLTLALVAGFFLKAGPIAAQSPSDGIENTITSQLEAFVARDVAEAFTYASPGIQGMFGSAQNFGMMVQNGYPMVWDNESVTYLELRELAGRIWQSVRIQDAAGGFHYLDYQMVMIDGVWRINGVRFLEAPDVGA